MNANEPAPTGLTTMTQLLTRNRNIASNINEKENGIIFFRERGRASSLLAFLSLSLQTLPDAQLLPKQSTVHCWGIGLSLGALRPQFADLGFYPQIEG